MSKFKILGVFTGPVIKHSDHFESAIKKHPREFLEIRKNGIDQDEVANLKYHGGDMRVVHHYSLKNYQTLKEKFPEISDRFMPGSFGENILTEELTESELNIGDIYSLGTAKIQLTVSRRPCATINQTYGDNRILKEVMTSGRTGWFYRVLEDGKVRPGDYLEFLERPYPHMPISKLYDFKDLDYLRKCLDTGLMDKGWKPKILKALGMCIFVISLFHGGNAFPLETDNYIVWKKNLKSSEKILNEFLTNNIQMAIDETKNKNLTCQEITKRIFRKFQSRFVHDNPVENYLLDHLSSDYIYPQNLHYVGESIYRDPFLPHIPHFGLAPNIQVNGYYFGTDKLSHFTSVGYIYYSKKSPIKGIEYGIRDEKTLHGYWASGVFSYADLEANYQGYLFYKNLCSDSQSMLKNINGNWIIKSKPKIAQYINAHWDESYYPSYRVERNHRKVSSVIQYEYCGLKNPRSEYYQKTSVKSFSMRYLEQVKNLPRPQEICK